MESLPRASVQSDPVCFDYTVVMVTERRALNKFAENFYLLRHGTASADCEIRGQDCVFSVGLYFDHDSIDNVSFNFVST